MKRLHGRIPLGQWLFNIIMISILVYVLIASKAVNKTCVIQTQGTVPVLFKNLTNLTQNMTKLPDKGSSTKENKPNHELFANHTLHPDYKYKLENPTLCSSSPDLKVLVVVHSAPSHNKNRQSIRATWTNTSYFPDLGPIKVLFLLGQVKNHSQQIKIQKEFDHYGDIVQGNFFDDYHNLTYKAIMGYKWLTERCRNVKVILKTDDDVVVNTFKFMKAFLPRFLTTSRLISCRRDINSLIHRNKKSKWYMPPHVLKGQTKYPDYCFGFMVAISNDIVPEMYQASLTTDYLWTDDVFMYGFVANKVRSIQYRSLIFKSDVIYGTKEPLKCYQTRKKECPYLAIVTEGDVSQKIRDLWRLIVNEQAT